MTHAAYWAATPAEISQRHDGYIDRREDRLCETAWALSHVLSAWSKKPIRPEQIFKPRGWLEQQRKIPTLAEQFDYESARREHRRKLREQGVAVPDDGLN